MWKSKLWVVRWVRLCLKLISWRRYTYQDLWMHDSPKQKWSRHVMVGDTTTVLCVVHGWAALLPKGQSEDWFPVLRLYHRMTCWAALVWDNVRVYTYLVWCKEFLMCRLCLQTMCCSFTWHLLGTNLWSMSGHHTYIELWLQFSHLAG